MTFFKNIHIKNNQARLKPDYKAIHSLVNSYALYIVICLHICEKCKKNRKEGRNLRIASD